jgi:hypothetical protein
MNTRNALSFILLVGLLFRTSALGAVLLNDTWDDGDRTDTNLPEESAWYGSTAFSTATLSASVGALRGNVLMFETNSSSRLWITHFAPAGSPAALAVGDTLKATLVFIPSNVTTSSGTTRGLRIGLFNFSEPGASRVSADGFSTGAGTGAPGTNVTGYILNMNFAETLIANPLQIMKRSVLETNNLMGTTGGGVYTSLGSGGGAQAGPGFQNGVPYMFEFIVKRSETGVEITTRFSDTNGWSIAHTVTDANNPNMRFDGLALRPNAVADSAQAFTVTQCKVELLPFELRISSIGLLPPFNDTAVSFPTQRGKTYQLEWRANFNPGSSWNSLGEVINGDGAVATRVDSDASFEVERYYRLVELPQ